MYNKKRINYINICKFVAIFFFKSSMNKLLTLKSCIKFYIQHTLSAIQTALINHFILLDILKVFIIYTVYLM